MRRKSALLSILTLLFLSGSTPVFIFPVPDQWVTISATPIDLDESHPAKRRLGELIFKGGWRLSSPSSLFGGLSGLVVANGEMMIVSDAGTLFRLGQMPVKPHVKALVTELPMGCGRRDSKPDRDSESLAHDPVGGGFWIGLESRNAICRMDHRGARMAVEASPAQMKGWPKTGGPETLTRLNDGRFLVISEQGRGLEATSPLLLFDGDPVVDGAIGMQLRYQPPRGFLAVDAAQLPDGRILVLNRRFSAPFSFTARVTAIDPVDFKPHATIAGRLVARFESPVVHDNFEALAVENTPDGPIIWILSDDNFLFLQQTLLLKFTL